MLNVEIDGPTWLRLTCDIEGVMPDDALRWFLEPELIATWWTTDARVEPRAGGAWEMRFPRAGKHLDGEIAEVTSTSLHVSWAWDDEPALPARSLVVRAEPKQGGTRLRIIQGPYRQSDAFPHEDEDRRSHLEGWEFFLPKLVDAIS